MLAFGSMRLLVVDDEPLVRRSLKRAAEARGHQVELASNGLEGKELWESFRPDLVFVDVLMPVMDGPTLLSKKPLESQAKIIMMSAFTGEYDGEAALKLGADLFIAKPFENIMDVMVQAERLIHGK